MGQAPSPFAVPSKASSLPGAVGSVCCCCSAFHQLSPRAAVIDTAPCRATPALLRLSLLATLDDPRIDSPSRLSVSTPDRPCSCPETPARSEASLAFRPSHPSLHLPHPHHDTLPSLPRRHPLHRITLCGALSVCTVDIFFVIIGTPPCTLLFVPVSLSFAVLLDRSCLPSGAVCIEQPWSKQHRLRPHPRPPSPLRASSHVLSTLVNAINRRFPHWPASRRNIATTTTFT